jgi:hypothetical protein
VAHFILFENLDAFANFSLESPFVISFLKLLNPIEIVYYYILSVILLLR